MQKLLQLQWTMSKVDLPLKSMSYKIFLRNNLEFLNSQEVAL